MSMLTMQTRDVDFLLSEAAGYRSRESAILASGAGALKGGAVLGQVSRRQAAAPIPTIVGTGSGVMSGLTFGPDVQVGNYVITLTQTSATAAFTVVAPDGSSLPNGAVATAYKSSHLSFLVANGGTMTTGDAYTVAVTAAGTPVLVGTGTGTVSGLSLGKYAMPGTYRVTVLTTSATSKLEVVAPDGSALAQGTIAVAYAGDHINFSLSNAGTMTAGDYFNVIVAGYAAPECKLLDPTAVDGSADFYGVLMSASDATSAAQDVTVIVRDAEVEKANLSWKSTITDGEKSGIYRLMASKNVHARS